jgi:hypothetical protein
MPAMTMIVATLLTGAAQTQPPTADDAALTPGTFSIALYQAGQGAPSDALFVDAVQSRLEQRGFIALPGEGHGRYIVTVTVDHQQHGQVASRTAVPPATIGAGVNFSLPTKAVGMHGLVVTDLAVTIAPRDGAQAAWHGSATTATVEDDDASESAVATKLADAVIDHFPAQSDGPIAVP